MKTIIAGSRTIEDYSFMERAVKESTFHITEVISGGARGVDTLAIRWAAEHNVPHVTLYANWALHGKAAGPIRNREMAERADALIALRRGGSSSKGTTDMIEQARKRGLQVFVMEVS